MSGIFFVLKTGCQWKALDATSICAGSTAHARFEEWVNAGVFPASISYGAAGVRLGLELGSRRRAEIMSVTEAMMPEGVEHSLEGRLILRGA